MHEGPETMGWCTLPRAKSESKQLTRNTRRPAPRQGRIGREKAPHTVPQFGALPAAGAGTRSVAGLRRVQCLPRSTPTSFPRASRECLNRGHAHRTRALAQQHCTPPPKLSRSLGRLHGGRKRTRPVRDNRTAPLGVQLVRRPKRGAQGGAEGREGGGQ